MTGTTDRDAGTEGPEPAYGNIVTGYSTFRSDRPFRCEGGAVLPSIDVAYETWGALSPARDNAVLLHTGLSASSHVRSSAASPQKGWWEEFVGPGLAIDTDRWFVACTNILGGCYGSTGPSSIDPRTGREYGPDFPLVTVADMVNAQVLLLDALGIGRLAGSIGSSLGGMQSLALSALHPGRVGRCVTISAAGRAHPQSIAMRFVQRQALMADPAWSAGRYREAGTFPRAGMIVAREIGTITYRSGPEWEDRFGRKRTAAAAGPPTLGPEFEVESYLVHQGEKFSGQYDPNSYLVISKAMDLFDIGSGAETYEAGLARVRCPTLVIGVRSDMLFPCWQQRELARLLSRAGTAVTHVEIDAPYGHDTFLIDVDRVGGAIRRHLESPA
jgi:homoserine O-acetyltransferase